MNILLTEGFYSTNIGNDYFMRGVRYVLEKALPHANIQKIGDLSSNFWKSNGKPFKNDFNYLKYVDVDYFVITGPCFDRYFPALYGDLLRGLKQNRTKLVFFSAGGNLYDNNEISLCSEYLKSINPDILVSRDEQTFNIYKQCFNKAYNGICGAFFINKYFNEIKTRFPGNYITLTFDNMAEPDVKIFGDNCSVLNENLVSIKVHDENRRFEKLISRSGMTFNNLFSGEGVNSIGNYTVIRPTHNSYCRFGFELFKKKNTYVSEVSDGYLNIYKNTSLNLTDRVHSSVASLVWGKPTRLFSTSKRADLLKRVGAEDVLNGICVMDIGRLSEEQEKMIQNVKKIFES